MLRSTLLLTLGLGSACAAARPPGAGALAPAAGVRHLRNIRQLTFGGHNPGASFSRSGRRLIVQRQERVDSGCDQRYVINVDGTGLRRITRRPGYDGGAVFSPDGRALAWRARYPETAADPAEYLDLPARRQLRSRLHSRRKAHHLCFQFPAAPQPELRPVRRDPGGRGPGADHLRSGVRRIPMFSPDGRRLVWASNRHAAVTGESDFFIADWVP